MAQRKTIDNYERAIKYVLKMVTLALTDRSNNKGGVVRTELWRLLLVKTIHFCTHCNRYCGHQRGMAEMT